MTSGAVFAQSWNLYQGNTSLALPYYPYPDAATNLPQLNWNSGSGFSNQPVNVHIAVGGKMIPVTLDTGSTGIAISQNYLPANALNGLKPVGYGAYNYDSSNNNPSGVFYELPVSLLGNLAGGAAASGSTTVKVLVVTSDTSTAYFGVGNNRNNIYCCNYNSSLTFEQNKAAGNIQQISAAGFNPLINVSLNGAALPNQGYVVMNNQIVVGLTATNNSYSFVKLTQLSNPGTNLWDAIPIALASGSSGYLSATVLHDTGIGYAFLKGWGADPEFLPGRVANLFLHLLDERFMFFEQTPVFGADEFADFPEVVANVIKNALETFLVLELSVELSVHLVRIGNWRYWFVRSGIRHPRPGISPVGDADAKLQRTKACARFFLALEIVL